MGEGGKGGGGGELHSADSVGHTGIHVYTVLQTNILDSRMC